MTWPARSALAATPQSCKQGAAGDTYVSGYVEGLAGSVVRVGGTLLAVEGTGNACPGLYAAVGQVGTVRVGDVVERVEHEA